MAKKRKQKQGTSQKKTKKTNPKLRIYALILAAISFLLYANTLGHDYALDDYSAIKDNYVTQKGVEGISTIFSTHYRHGYWNSPGELYRPITLSVFAIGWDLFGDNPALFHFVNVLFYSITAIVLFFTLSQILRGYSLLLPFFASLLFIAHPVHVEVVANIKSLDEILAFLFSIGALGLLWKFWGSNNFKWLILSLLSYLIAMFSKENAITFLAVFPLVYLFFQKDFAIKKLAVTGLFFIPAGIYLMVRQSVLGTVSSAKATSLLDNILVSADGFGEQLASAFLFIGKYLFNLFLPLNLGSDFGYNQIPLTNFEDWRVLLTIFVVLVALFYAGWSLLRQKNPMAFGILFFAINFSIFSNILIVIGTNYGDRLLYASSLGFTIFLTFLILKLFNKELKNNGLGVIELIKNAKPIVAVFMGIFLFYSFKTIDRNAAWKDSFMLYETDIYTAPNSAKLNYHYGLELCKKGDNSTTDSDKKINYELGMKHLFKAIEIYPKYADAYSRIGLTYYEGKDYENALKNYQLSIKHKPNNAKVYSNMGTLYFETGNAQKAIESYQKAVKVDPRFVDGWRNLGSLNAQQGNFGAAIRAFQEALKYAPDDATINFYLGSAYLDSGQEALGRPFLDKAYSLNPNLPRK